MHLEPVALLRAVQNLQLHYAGRHFQERSDDTSMGCWQNIEAPGSSVILKYRSYLVLFDFELEPLTGRRNSIADTLSRFPSSVPNVQLKPAGASTVESPQPPSQVMRSDPPSMRYTKDVRLVTAAFKNTTQLGKVPVSYPNPGISAGFTPRCCVIGITMACCG